MSPMINYTAEFSSTRIVQSASFSLPRSQKNIPWEIGIISRARDLTRFVFAFCSNCVEVEKLGCSECELGARRLLAEHCPTFVQSQCPVRVAQSIYHFASQCPDPKSCLHWIRVYQRHTFGQMKTVSLTSLPMRMTRFPRLWELG